MSTITRYIQLMTQFTTGRITAAEFEFSYLEKFKNEKESFPEDVYDALNNLFLDVDTYCDDPALRDDEDIDDEGLRASVIKTLKELT